MAHFKLTPAALASLHAIGGYTARQWGTKQQDAYMKKLDKRFHALARTPLSGKMRDDIAPGIRSHHEGKHVIFYRLRETYIIIIDILHERMDPALRLTER